MVYLYRYLLRTGPHAKRARGRDEVMRLRLLRPTTAAAAVASLLLHCSPPHRRAPPPRLAVDADEVRIVCVSDTHGFEGQLPPVPPGDLLIHCGDFAPDGGSTVRLRAVEAFDEWLAAQPHKVKLVIRGNHDPRSATFPVSGVTACGKRPPCASDGPPRALPAPECSARAISCTRQPGPTRVLGPVRPQLSPSRLTPTHPGATYICKPTSVTVGAVVVHSVPYTRGRLREPIPPCDVLATHSPPKGVLDLCYPTPEG